MKQGQGYVYFGKDHDEATLVQMRDAVQGEPNSRGVLCADGHYGYGLPVGGVIASNRIAPAFVGYDIGCGNKAVKTNLKVSDLYPDFETYMDMIWETIPFGVGGSNKNMPDKYRALAVDYFYDRIFYNDGWIAYPNNVQVSLRAQALSQLGSVGAGNHYVDLLEDENGYLWIGVHFGSRGLGHKTATGFLHLAQHNPWSDKRVDEVTTSFHPDSPAGQGYLAAMNLCLDYAYAGRDLVCDIVMDLIGVKSVEEVHNNHNFAQLEKHFGREYYVTRKGATPSFPGQRGFIGGSMGDSAFIVEGVESNESRMSLYSSPHGAGRVMSRRKAAGKTKYIDGVRTVVEPGEISQDDMNDWINKRSVILRGGGLDEAPQAYRRLKDVLAEHKNTIKLIHELRPIGVAMAN